MNFVRDVISPGMFLPFNGLGCSLLQRRNWLVTDTRFYLLLNRTAGLKCVISKEQSERSEFDIAIAIARVDLLQRGASVP
jgi:hypothetical protein